jgi:uncharacterized protein (DUF1697 family)
MASVVFLRGVNVGGRKAFQPTAFVRDMAAFDVVNIGAAGTFVVRKRLAEAALRAELIRRLPFEAEVMICRARDVLDLAAAEPFGSAPRDKDVARYVTILARRPRTLPGLPICRPEGKDWQVKVVAVVGRFVLSLHRRMGRSLVYPNEVVEKKLGVSATTRNWNTIAAISCILQSGSV